MARDKILKPFLGIVAPENKFTVDTIDDLKSRSYLTIDDIVDLNGYYTAGDGAHHKRKIERADDGSGVQLANGLWANIIHEGSIDITWLGCKGDNSFDNTSILQKAFDIFYGCEFIMPKGVFVSEPLFVRGRQTIVGCGVESVLKLKNNYNGEKIALIQTESKDGKSSEHVTLKNFRMTGSSNLKVGGPYATTSEIHGVYMLEQGGDRIDNYATDARHKISTMFIDTFTGNGIVMSCREAMITDTFSCRNARAGLKMAGSDSYINNFTSYHNTEHGIFNTGEDHKYSNVKCFGNATKSGLFAGFYTSLRVTCSNLSVQENGGPGIECSGEGHCSFNGVFLSSNNTTDIRDENGSMIPHPNGYQVKIDKAFGVVTMNGVVLSDFRKTLVKKIFYINGEYSGLIADVSIDPNLKNKLDVEDYLTTTAISGYRHYNTLKITVDGTDILRESSKIYKSTSIGGFGYCKVATVRLKRQSGRGSSFYGKIKINTSIGNRSVFLAIQHEESAQTCSIKIKEDTGDVYDKFDILCAPSKKTDTVIWYDVFIKINSYSFVDAKIESLDGFNLDGVDMNLIPMDLPPYIKLFPNYPNDYYQDKSKKIILTKKTNENFTKATEVSKNVIMLSGELSIAKPTSDDPNLGIVTKSFAMPETFRVVDIVSITCVARGYVENKALGYNCFLFAVDYDLTSNLIHLKVSKIKGQTESVAGESCSNLNFIVSVTLDATSREI